MTTDTDSAKGEAQAQFESIEEMVKALNDAYQSENDEAIETARETIEEDALSVQVRSDWHDVGEEAVYGEYTILLCTGGPACRIIGTLSKHNEPESARIEYQDWFTPWEDFPLTSEQEKTVLQYASVFWFGD